MFNRTHQFRSKSQRFLILFFIFLLFSDKSNATTTYKVDSLPPLPEALARRIMDSCTLIDYTFLSLPFTMSFDNNKSVQGSFRHIQVDGVEEVAGLKVFAKTFFQIQGRIILVGDLYFSNAGAYFVYSEDGVKKYGNKLSQEGIDFFNQIITRQKK